jgi:hypothetical protein
MGAVPNVLDMRILKFYHAMELIDALWHLIILNVVVNPAWGSHSVRRA